MRCPLDEADSFPDRVAEAASPIDDVRGTAAYRRHALRVLARAASSAARMRIDATVNGEPVEADVWEGECLLFALRERLGFPGSKNACEQGECGSCSVLLDGRSSARASCWPRRRTATRSSRSRGSPTATSCTRCSRPTSRRARSSAASARRASSCRPPTCCERVPRPTDDEIREALSGNLCRCTGYAKIFDAVRLAAERDCPPSGSSSSAASARVVARVDAIPKVTGEFAYSSDLIAPGMLWGHTVRSPHPHARIRGDRRLRRGRRCPASTRC